MFLTSELGPYPAMQENVECDQEGKVQQSERKIVWNNNRKKPWNHFPTTHLWPDFTLKPSLSGNYEGREKTIETLNEKYKFSEKYLIIIESSTDTLAMMDCHFKSKRKHLQEWEWNLKEHDSIYSCINHVNFSACSLLLIHKKISSKI